MFRKESHTRMDALTDGVFSVISTLLVLDIHVPHIPSRHSATELLNALKETVPSIVAFAFSFMTVMIYWINHDQLSMWLKEYNAKAKYLNIVLLFFLCLIPFPTRFISEYPTEPMAVFTYGLLMFLMASTALMNFRYLAFQSDLLDTRILPETRKKYAIRIAYGPLFYGIAAAVAFQNTNVSIAIFILIPLFFVLLPKVQLNEEEKQ